jgi:glycosyltransferase involved in cell wall biosynthesis
MLERSISLPAVHVLVATPSATMGQGGVDRVMATLKMQLEREGRIDVAARFLPSRGSGSVLLSPFYAASFCFEMLRARLIGQVDVVHINLASSGSTYRKLVIAGIARVLKIPYVLHLHGAEYRSFWREQGVISLLIRRMFERASQVIVLGRVWQEFIARRAPAVADRITVVPNASPAPSLERHGGGDKVHILFLGRLGERKGVPQLVQALHSMRQHGHWRATIAGDGQVEAVRAQASDLGIAERISLPGWVGPDAVARLIASADILVLPSFAENLPVSVIEAMAAGLAVVATPVGAIEDIIVDGETGLLVPPGDVVALADAMTRLVLDPAKRAQLGQNALLVHRERLDLAPFAQSICNIWINAAHEVKE